MKFAVLFALSVLALAAAPERQLAVTHPAISDTEDGTPVPSDLLWHAGDTLFFRCQVTGYARQEKDDETRISLNYRIDVQDEAGVPLVPPESGKIAALVGQEDRKWEPVIREAFPLPPLLGAGAFKIAVHVTDEYGKAQAGFSMPFHVGGYATNPGESLAIHNVRFLRTEADSDALTQPAYQRGDTVWVRFEITGYKFGPQNERNVEYGFRVLRPDGTVSFEQPLAASERKSSYYPQRYTPAAFSITLPRDLQAGAYKVEISARDKLGDGRAAAAGTFTVE